MGIGMRQLAVIHSYQDLQQALRRRADALDISNETLDQLCGFADRYSSKVLGLHPCRRLGRVSLSALLTVMGLTLILFEDPEQIAKMRPRLVRRRKNGPGRHIEPTVSAGSDA
jgi:hypothetical protein